jgi:hypothetical protein
LEKAPNIREEAGLLCSIGLLAAAYITFSHNHR